jgi:ubiquinone/menaquinone biosynthesis C-methylase UbiE
MSSPKSHYQSHTAESYESAFFYSPGAYMDYLSKLVTERMKLDESSHGRRRILDIGGGTGNFTKMLVESRPHIEAIVLDPYLQVR